MRWLRRYHRYRVLGTETFPREGGVLVAATHSLATYENFLLASACSEILERPAWVLGDDLIFQNPVTARIAHAAHLIPGNRESATTLLREGEVVGLGPGGMREALRSSKERYRVDWEGRYGFVRVALAAGVPIVLAACPAADELFHVYDVPFTKAVYARHHLPAPLFRGFGPTLLPRPVRLWHLMSEPFPPPVAPEDVTDEVVRTYHAALVTRMERLMGEALALGDRQWREET